MTPTVATARHLITVVGAPADGIVVISNSVAVPARLTVRIVDRAGAGLADAVVDAFVTGPRPVPPAMFDPWRPYVVREELRVLLNELAAAGRG